jgi:N-acetylmuramoyl-L-alanine amidase
MGFYHTVEQGDDLPSIAREHGFSDYRTLWDAPENAELKQTRQDPGVLFPGDRVFVPDVDQGGKSVAVGQHHRFVLRGKRPRLRLVLRGPDDRPLAATAVALTVDGEPRSLTTDGDGLLDTAIRPGAREATLAFAGQTLELKIGHLDPVDKQSGLIARLRNLGYLPGALETAAEAEVPPDELALAVELFQRDRKLPIDGSDPEQIATPLREAHGC